MAKKMGGGNSYRGKLPKKTRQGMSNLTKRGRKGGFLSQAVVPFGLFALQKRTQNRRGSKSAKKSRHARRSRRNRRSGRR